MTGAIKRPTFFVIGAQRAGTTRLCHLLDQHPEIVIPTKEPFYFQDPVSVREKHDWYWSLFANAADGSVYGEGSTYYSMRDTYPGTAMRIYEYEAASRIIYMVRHPLRRIESAWYQLLYTREISGLKTFKQAILDSDILIEPTLYWRQISAYREYFPDEQIHVAVFEDFVRDESATIGSCLEFLGLAPTPSTLTTDDTARNESATKVQPWLLIDLLKALPGYGVVKHAVPESLRWSMGRRMLKPIRSRPEWDRELLDHVLEQVEPDASSLLAHIGLPTSYWDLREVDGIASRPLTSGGER